MAKIAVIGGGISGLGIAQRLKKQYEITVFEADSRPGGLIKCDRVEGNLFHIVGGHIFNSRRQDVLDWFWNFFDCEKEFTKIPRNAVVSMPDGRLIMYPIENHIYQMSPEEMKAIIKDLIQIAKSDKGEPRNFEEFLRTRFGDTLYKLYFQPYNEKVWRKDLTAVPLSWLAGKLPMPTVEEIILNNFNQVEEMNMVHSSFWYARKDGSQFIANRMAENLKVVYNSTITRIEKSGDKWSVGGDQFDKVIFCGNIKDFPAMVTGSIDISGYEKSIEELDFHGTTVVFCEMENNPYSWIYMPGREHQSHRFICTGNYAASNNVEGKTTTSLEFTDYISKEDIDEQIKKIPFSPKYITHKYTKYTYPIQFPTSREMISSLKSVAEKEGVYLLGRFAEWEYYNMDAALGAGLDLAKRI